MTRIAVTGAGGFLGRYLCRHFGAAGWSVRALVRDPDAVATVLPAAERVRCELPDGVTDEMLRGCDVLVHAAYATKETDPERMRRVNEDGTRRLFDAARRVGVGRIVLISTVAADPNAPNYYARSKALCESWLDPCRDLVIRPGLILGREGRGLFQQMRDIMRTLHVVPLFGGGRQPLQTVHVDDLCAAIVRAIERGMVGSLNIAEADPPTLGGFLRQVATKLRIRCVFLPLPLTPVLATVRVLERLGVPVPLRSESLLGMQALRALPVQDDLARLELTVRSAAESLDDIL